MLGEKMAGFNLVINGHSEKHGALLPVLKRIAQIDGEDIGKNCEILRRFFELKYRAAFIYSKRGAICIYKADRGH